MQKHAKILDGASEGEIGEASGVGPCRFTSPSNGELPLSATAEEPVTSSGVSSSQASELADSFASQMSLGNYGDCGGGGDSGIHSADKGEGWHHCSRAPLQPQLTECGHEGMAPIPLTSSRSSPLDHASRYDGYRNSENEDDTAADPYPTLLARMSSMPPVSLRPSWSRSRSTGSALCLGTTGRGFSAFTEPTLIGKQSSRSDPAISAFNPVRSLKSSMKSTPEPNNGSSEEVNKNKTCRSSKFFSGLRSITRKKSHRSGRENPARPPSSSGDSSAENIDDCASTPSPPKKLEPSRLITSGRKFPWNIAGERTMNSSEATKHSKTADAEIASQGLSGPATTNDVVDELHTTPVGTCRGGFISTIPLKFRGDRGGGGCKVLLFEEGGGAATHNDPGVALSCSSSTSDENDKFVEQIVGTPRRPSMDILSLPSEVRGASPAYHTLADEHGGKSVTDDDENGVIGIRLRYKTPAGIAANCDSSPPNRMAIFQNHESSPSSYDSHVSNSNSRITSQSVSQTSTSGTIRTEASSNDADLEVREANHRSPSRREEVLIEMDGNTTVYSSSTTSSNFRTYNNSPKSLRDGACMQVDRYFAGGVNNITPPKTNDGIIDMRSAEIDVANSSQSSLKKNKRDLSPHTISSASRSTSSGSDTKKPLRFVAYESEERESPAQIVDYSRLSLDCQSDKACVQTTALRPRTTKGSDKRLPRFKYQRPPLSPGKTDWARNADTRTPTRTPPPTQLRESHSECNTPCSPPAIVDDPGVLYSEIRRSGTAKPNVVRSARLRPASSFGSKGGKMILLPPSTVAMSVAGVRSHAPVAMKSRMRDSMIVVGGGSSDGAQEVFTVPVHPVSVVSPHGRASFHGDVLGATESGISCLHHNHHPTLDGNDSVSALVTPEKGS